MKKKRGGKRPKQYGSQKERDYANMLREEGYKVERAGSSLGDYDLIAITTTNSDGEGHSLWVQVKAGSRDYIKRCRREWKPGSLPPYHVVRLACWIKKENCWYEQDGDGEARRRER